MSPTGHEQRPFTAQKLDRCCSDCNEVVLMLKRQLSPASRRLLLLRVMTQKTVLHRTVQTKHRLWLPEMGVMMPNRGGSKGFLLLAHVEYYQAQSS